MNPAALRGETSADRREFIRALRASGHTLEEIGSGLGITRERVRQLCEKYDIAKPNGVERAIDPIRVMEAAHKATSIREIARIVGTKDTTAVSQCLTALGVMPAFKRLKRMRRKQRLLNELRAKATELGRTPTNGDLGMRFTTYYRVFGKLSTACLLAGLTPRSLGGAGHITPRALGTHCNRGHEYTPENTYVYVNNRGYRCRQCKACKRVRLKLRRGGRQTARQGSRPYSLYDPSA